MTAIVLVGCHGAGKSTLGALLAERLAVPFHDETGRRLAESLRHRPEGVTAADAQQGFDEQVMRLELERDESWALDGLRVVETWHPGNLAYAELRGSRVDDLTRARILRRIQREKTLLVLVHADECVLRARQSEPGDIGFFVEVAMRACTIARRLGMPAPITIDSGVLSPEQAASKVVEALSCQIAGGGASRGS